MPACKCTTNIISIFVCGHASMCRYAPTSPTTSFIQITCFKYVGTDYPSQFSGRSHKFPTIFADHDISTNWICCPETSEIPNVMSSSSRGWNWSHTVQRCATVCDYPGCHVICNQPTFFEMLIQLLAWAWFTVKCRHLWLELYIF